MWLYSVYYTSVDSSTCFGGWHPSSGARTTVITASGTDQLGLLPPARVVVGQLFNLIHDARTHEYKIHWCQTGKRALPIQKHQNKTV